MCADDACQLPYERATVYRASMARARWRLAAGVVGGVAYAVVGGAIAAFPLHPLGIFVGATSTAIGGLAVVCVLLLHHPAATWLRIGETGMTYCVMFWRRETMWSAVRALQLVEAGGGVLIEVVMVGKATSRTFELGPLRPYVGKGSWAIVPQLFGSSAAALVDEMDDWRAGNADR